MDGEGGSISTFPNRGGDLRVINSYVVGNFAAPRRRATEEVFSWDEGGRNHPRHPPSRAISSRIGTPPTSKMTRPVGTLEYVKNVSMHA